MGRLHRPVLLREVVENIKLIDGGWIEDVKDRTKISVEDLKITDKFSREVLKIPNVKNITFDDAFNQLRDTFPIKAGNSERRLQ